MEPGELEDESEGLIRAERDRGAPRHVPDRLSTASKLRFAVALQLNALPSDLVLTQVRVQAAATALPRMLCSCAGVAHVRVPSSSRHTTTHQPR